jgi:LmbE family N-acetylglucosaminyl deacetylase
MRPLGLARPGDRLSVLCLGAHADDIEIGAGGTLLTWIANGAHLDVLWCVLSASGPRADEAYNSASRLLEGAASVEIRLAEFRDGFFPNDGGRIKQWMEELKPLQRPDVIFTHRGDDAHQDHREISHLTWNTYRDQLILEYEVPKWDGDLGRPNMYSALPVAILDRKIELLMASFATQRSKDWFDPQVFRGLARLRGMECRAPDGYAEAFHLRKGLLG